MDDQQVETDTIAEESRRLSASWAAARATSKPPPSPSRRRIGRIAVAISAFALIALCAALVSDSLIGGVGDPKDGGWADIAFVISPFLAIACAFVVGLVLVVVAAFRLIDLTVRQAGGAMLVGMIVAPVLYVLALIVSASALDAVQSVRVMAAFVAIWPAICGIGVTLISALVLHRRGRPATANPSAG